MNRYRVRLPLTVTPKPHPMFHTLETAYGQGDEFDYEFSEEDEKTNLDSGLLEIVPRTYKVIGSSVVDDTQPGDTFEAALTIGREAQLIAGGNIERVEPNPVSRPAPRKTKE